MLVPALVLIISWTCDGMALKHTQISAVPIARRIDGGPSYTMTHMPRPSVMPSTEIISKHLRISSTPNNSELFGVYVCVLILVLVGIIYFNQPKYNRLTVSHSQRKKPYLVSYDDLDMNNMYRHVRRQVITSRNTVMSSNTTSSAMV
jgi:hypothetical protein